MDQSSQRVWASLQTVKDPELPVISVVELGIVREVTISTAGVDILITPTYSGCPAMLAIEHDIKAALHAAGYPAVSVRTTLTPAWSSDWISAAGRRKLRDYGIVPPCRQTAATDTDAVVMQFVVRCPRCESSRTEVISEFGSTACKALYRCRDCLEPFDYFKPL